MDMFFMREAAAVRHVMYILTEYAQLNAVPLSTFPSPIDSPGIPASCEAAWARLCRAASGAGYGKYALSLLKKLYGDYIYLNSENSSENRSSISLAAIFYLFFAINGMEPDLDNCMKRFNISSLDKLTERTNSIMKLLKCVPYDPRYLTEEGFVGVLYI